jgi:hypothetical protein
MYKGRAKMALPHIGYLLYICNNTNRLNLKILKSYFTVGNPFLISPNPLFYSTSRYGFKLPTKFKPPMKNCDLLQNWADRLCVV